MGQDNDELGEVGRNYFCTSTSIELGQLHIAWQYFRDHTAFVGCLLPFNLITYHGLQTATPHLAHIALFVSVLNRNMASESGYNQALLIHKSKPMKAVKGAAVTIRVATKGGMN